MRYYCVARPSVKVYVSADMSSEYRVPIDHARLGIDYSKPAEVWLCIKGDQQTSPHVLLYQPDEFDMVKPNVLATKIYEGPAAEALAQFETFAQWLECPR